MAVHRVRNESGSRREQNLTKEFKYSFSCIDVYAEMVQQKTFSSPSDTKIKWEEILVPLKSAMLFASGDDIFPSF